MGTKRSRSGCWTCRQRHQKCDETKPECLNCRIRGVECGGYGIRLTEFTIRPDGQMVSKVSRSRGGPRQPEDQETNTRKRAKHQEVGTGEAGRVFEATQDSDNRDKSIDHGSVSSNSPQLDPDDHNSNPEVNQETRQEIATEERLTQLSDHASILTHRSTESVSPGLIHESYIDSNVQECTSNGASPDITHQVEADLEVSYQSPIDAVTYHDLLSEFPVDTSKTPSFVFEPLIGSFPTHPDPVNFFIDDPILDFGLDPPDSGEDEDPKVNDTASQSTTDQILPRFSSRLPLPPSPSDPFEQYLFCHYMENLSLCLYPIRPDLNPYRDIYGSLAARSSPLRSAIMFASAFHLTNLGRLPRFAIQPYRKAMREAFRKGLTEETDIEGLAATALLSVVFDVIGTGLDSWSYKLLGCRRLLKNAIVKSNGSIGASLQCMIVQYNWAATMSRTLLRDVKPKHVIEELGTAIQASDLDLADESIQGAESQSLWWHNLPDHTMHLMLREATDLATQLDQLKESCSPVDKILRLMPQAGELVSRLKSWDPDVSTVDPEYGDSVEHFNAIWQLGMLCFVYHEIYTLSSDDARIQRCIAAAIEPLKKLSWLQACLFPLFMLTVHAQTPQARSVVENALTRMHASLAFQTPLSMLLSLKNIWEFSDTHGASDSRWRDLVKSLSMELNILL